MYVSSSTNPLPEIKQVIAVYGTQVALEPTFAAALNDIFGQIPPGVQGSQSAQVSSNTKTSLSQSAATLISQAQTLYNKAQAALKAGDLGQYQADIDQVGSLLHQLAGSTKG
jgi:uncharacterized membrane protein (UPF0182 family)